METSREGLLEGLTRELLRLKFYEKNNDLYQFHQVSIGYRKEINSATMFKNRYFTCMHKFDLHKVVITLSYFTKIQSFIYHWIPC